jgi:hypothetical protein
MLLLHILSSSSAEATNMLWFLFPFTLLPLSAGRRNGVNSRLRYPELTPTSRQFPVMCIYWRLPPVSSPLGFLNVWSFDPLRLSSVDFSLHFPLL